MTEVARPARRRASAEKTRPSVFWPLALAVIPAVGWFAKIEITGAEHLPAEGPYILAPNHYSEFDPLILAVGTWRMGRAPRFMAKESLFRVPVLGAALRATGMVPVARSASSSAARQTLQQSEDLVRHGRGVIVYPEGSLTRDPDMWPMRGKTGAVRLALEHGVPVVPVAHWGVQAILPRWGKKLRLRPRKHVAIRVGPPLDLAGVAAQDSAAVAAATERLMDAVTGLLQGIRGGTPPAERFDPAAHGQPEFGRPDGV